MDVGAGRRVAAGTHHVVEYLPSPETIGLPLAPAHCPAVLIWRDQIVPSLDLTRLFPSPQAARGAWDGAVILAYQEVPGKPLRYGALLVYGAPEEAWVSNDMACPLPKGSAAFQYFTRACFAHQDQAIPVLDTRTLFSEAPPRTPTPDESEAEDAPNPVEPAPVRPAAFDTPRPPAEASKVQEQETSHTGVLSNATGHQCASVEEAAPLEPSTDATCNTPDFSPDLVAPASEARPHALLPPPATVPAVYRNHALAIAEASLEEHRTLRCPRAQQIIEETLVALHNEVGLKRILFAVPADAGKSICARYYRGIGSNSPLRGFRFERGDSNLFARLVEKPQHVWVHAGNWDRLVRPNSAEMRELLGESEFCAASIFVHSRLMGVCYGDEFPFTAGLDEHQYQQFKDLCNSLMRRLEGIAI